LAHVGAVRLDVSVEEFIERFLDIETFERGSGTRQIGRLGDPAGTEDLESLRLPLEDVDELRTCRPGDCAIKLSASAMEQFRRGVNWTSADAGEQVNTLTRAMILDLVRAYQANGNEALGRYDDGGESLLVAEQLEALLRSEEAFPERVPALLSYLNTYPAGRPAGAQDFFYWTVVNFGLKDTIRVNHVTVSPLSAPSPSGAVYVIATKQIYASHYFHTTLELRFLFDDDRRDGGAGAALVSITRSRNDGMTGVKGLFLGPVISRRSRTGVANYLRHMKQQLESPVGDS
jgi:hypothetical protein